MSLGIVPFRPEHIAQISGREFDRKLADELKGDEWFDDSVRMNGPAFTAYRDDKVIACGGIVMFWAGCGEAWLYTSEEIEENKIWFSRAIKRWLWMLIKNMNLRRVQVSINTEYARSQRWAEWLGFVKESEMPLYGPCGETFIRYVILRT